MKKIKDLLITLNERYPFEDAEKWDNIGLLVGSENNTYEKVYVTLELTSDIIDKAEEGSVIITHHPLIFSPLNIIDFDSFKGKIIKELIKKDISYISLHTNYDKHFLNKYFIEEILEQKIIETDGFLSYFEVNKKNLEEVISIVKNKMKLEELSYVGNEKDEIKKIAVCTGSGSSEIKNAKKNGAQLLLTGDITYHTAVEAKEINMGIIDITHYNSEKYFGVDLEKDMGFEKLLSKDPFKRG